MRREEVAQLAGVSVDYYVRLERGRHVNVGRYPDDPQLAELIGDLSVRDTDFRRWWADHRPG